MASQAIRRDDQVIVIGGKDRGKTGRVLRVDPKRAARLRRGPEHRSEAPQRPQHAARHPARAQTSAA